MGAYPSSDTGTCTDAGVAVGNGVAVNNGVSVGNGVGVAVGVAVGTGVSVGSGVGVAVGNGVSVGNGVGVAVGVGVTVGTGVLVIVGVTVAVGVTVGMIVRADVMVMVGNGLGRDVGTNVTGGVAVGFGVVVNVGTWFNPVVTLELTVGGTVAVGAIVGVAVTVGVVVCKTALWVDDAIIALFTTGSTSGALATYALETDAVAVALSAEAGLRGVGTRGRGVFVESGNGSVSPTICGMFLVALTVRRGVAVTVAADGCSAWSSAATSPTTTLGGSTIGIREGIGLGARVVVAVALAGVLSVGLEAAKGVNVAVGARATCA